MKFFGKNGCAPRRFRAGLARGLTGVLTLTLGRVSGGAKPPLTLILYEAERSKVY